MITFKRFLVETTLKTLLGSTIKRYKNLVGKDIGQRIFVHKDYANEVIPNEIIQYGLKHLPPNFKYNCLMWNRIGKIIRFDSSPDFDTSREPITGDYIAISYPDGKIRRGHGDQIWHHKWLWVKDDYKGFDVEQSKNWSKTWLSKLPEPASGRIDKWQQQLNTVGLR